MKQLSDFGKTFSFNEPDSIRNVVWTSDGFFSTHELSFMKPCNPVLVEYSIPGTEATRYQEWWETENIEGKQIKHIGINYAIDSCSVISDICFWVIGESGKLEAHHWKAA